MSSDRVKKTSNKAKRKKLPIIVVVLLSIIAFLIVGCIVLYCLGINLLGRISRPAVPTTFVEDPYDFEDEDPTPTPVPTPSPTPVPAATATPAVSPTPEPTPLPSLPVSDYYVQTYLTDEQVAKMDADNANEQVINVLLLGVDRRASKGNSRADTMIIATLDKVHGKLKLSTLMRDTLVPIEGHAYNKLNAAAAFGGIDLLLSTINDVYHLKIDKYVLVDFFMFEKAVDALGGVTVNMTAKEISAANDNIAGYNREMEVDYRWDGFIFANEGPVHLTGKQALGFARIRKIDSEFKRTDRQFTILNTIFSMFLDESVSRQYEIMYELLPYIETDMTNDEIISLAVDGLKLNVRGFSHHRAPMDGTFENGRYERRFVFLADLPANAWELHNYIYDSDAKGEAAARLTPGPSLPPRTPSPTMVLPDGTVIYLIDGVMPTLTPVPGSIVLPDGTVLPEGSTVRPDGTVLLPDGTIIAYPSPTVDPYSDYDPYATVDPGSLFDPNATPDPYVGG